VAVEKVTEREAHPFVVHADRDNRVTPRCSHSSCTRL
jgi:hypothetical protein